MTHPDDDTLLKHVLKLLDSDEERGLEEHLSQCDGCQAKLEEIRRHTELIGSIEPEIEDIHYPMPRIRRLPLVTVLKAAALVMIGFAAGYGASSLSGREPVTVVPQRVEVASPSTSLTGFTTCESLDMAVNTDWLNIHTQEDSLDT
jgi:anti-sigma factor RsiW